MLVKVDHETRRFWGENSKNPRHPKCLLSRYFDTKHIPQTPNLRRYSPGRTRENDWNHQCINHHYPPWLTLYKPYLQGFPKPIWVFPKTGVPQNGWFIRENPIKIDDFGGTTIFGHQPSQIIRFIVFHLGPRTGAVTARLPVALSRCCRGGVGSCILGRPTDPGEPWKNPPLLRGTLW